MNNEFEKDRTFYSYEDAADGLYSEAIDKLRDDTSRAIGVLGKYIQEVEKQRTEIDKKFYWQGEKENRQISPEVFEKHQTSVEDFQLALFKSITHNPLGKKIKFNKFYKEAVENIFFKDLHPDECTSKSLKISQNTINLVVPTESQMISDDEDLSRSSTIINYRDTVNSELNYLSEQCDERALKFLDEDTRENISIQEFINNVEDLASYTYPDLTEKDENDLIEKLKSLDINNADDFKNFVLAKYITFNSDRLDFNEVRQSMNECLTNGEVLTYLNETYYNLIKEWINICAVHNVLNKKENKEERKAPNSKENLKKQIDRIGVLIDIVCLPLKIEEDRLITINKIQKEHTDLFDKIESCLNLIDHLDSMAFENLDSAYEYLFKDVE